MSHGHPGSQNRALLREKEAVAVQLIGRGLTTSQIAAQLRCSPFFVRRIRRNLEAIQLGAD